MADNDRMRDEGNSKDLSRRDLVKLSVAGALAASAGTASASAVDVVESDVKITMPDGMCDAAFIHPAKGAHAGVLVWPDAFGLRPAMRDIGKRIAAEGYSVLVPNPYYRASPATGIDLNPKTFSFGNQDDMARLRKLMGGLQAPGMAEKDAVAYIAWLDAQKQVNKKKKIGTQGYCMGGPLVFKTCAAVPDRVGAGASFHGGGLVTDQSSSPHLLISKMKAQMYVGIASNDDSRQPGAKDILHKAFEAAKVMSEIEVYKGLHGWCVPDMPLQGDGTPTYDKPDAEKAWGKLVALYKTALG
jgi:carboxymethylenebutenolidase